MISGTEGKATGLRCATDTRRPKLCCPRTRIRHSGRRLKPPPQESRHFALGEGRGPPRRSPGCPGATAGCVGGRRWESRGPGAPPTAGRTARTWRGTAGTAGTAGWAAATPRGWWSCCRRRGRSGRSGGRSCRRLLLPARRVCWVTHTGAPGKMIIQTLQAIHIFKGFFRRWAIDIGGLTNK